jgi:hypothetical protein
LAKRSAEPAVGSAAGAIDEGGQMLPAAFRAALASVLGLEPVRRIASIQGTRPPRKG